MLAPARRRHLAAFVPAILALALAAGVAAQSPSPDPAIPVEETATVAPADPWPTGDWDVPAFDPWAEGLVEPSPDSPLTVSFLDAGRLEGETGCGTYYGRYLVDRDAISLGVISKGPDPCSTAVTEEAVAFSVALDAVTSWRASETGLELLDDAGVVRVVLEPARGRDVQGDWVAERYWRANGRPAEPLPRNPVEIGFGEDGRVSGSSGCRLVDGEYLRSGDQLIVAVDTIGLPCEGDLRRQERRVMRALDAVVLWQRDGDRLLLTDGFGEPLLELRAAPVADTADPDEVAG